MAGEDSASLSRLTAIQAESWNLHIMTPRTESVSHRDKFDRKYRPRWIWLKQPSDYAIIVIMITFFIRSSEQKWQPKHL